jgi:DNA replication protein DnaC
MLKHLKNGSSREYCKAVDVMQEFIYNPIGCVLLAGLNGTGKTFLAKSVYNAISPHRLPLYNSDLAIFITQSEMNMKWSGFIKKYGDADYYLTQLCNTKLLIIDDLAVVRAPSPAFLDFLFVIADSRYENRHAVGTIVTTNKSEQELLDGVGHAFVSRIAWDRCIRFDGEDRRCDISNSNDKAPSLTKQGSSNTIITLKDNCLRIAYKASNLTIRIFN